MGRGNTVQIDAQVKLQVANQAKVMKDLYEQLQDAFAEVDPSSSLGKNLAKVFSMIERKLSSAEGLLGRDLFTDADLKKVTTQLDSVSQKISEIEVQSRNMSPIALGVDTKEIDAAEARLRNLRAEIANQKKAGVGTILGVNNKDLQSFVAHSKDTGFNASKSYDANYRAMENSLGRVQGEYANLAIAAQEAQRAIAESSKEITAAQQALNSLQKGQSQIVTYNQNVAGQILGAKHSKKEDTIKDLHALVDAQLDSDTWSQDGSEFIEVITNWMNINPADLAGPARTAANKIKKAISDAINAKGGLQYENNSLFANAKGALDGDVNVYRKDAQYRNNEEQQDFYTTQLQLAETNQENAKTQLNAVTNEMNQASQLLDTITQQMARLKELQKEYNALVDNQNKSKLETAKKDIAQAKDKATQPKRKIITGVSKGASQAVEEIRGVNDAVDQEKALRQQQAAAEAAAKAERDQFTSSIKNAFKQWLSLSQIINIIKNGIRQAYQDIQGLDQAMTNIAVVTDMSVSNLWGKINEYMSIAQQYGVTTQGVYEVSQLYYQQGLSTSEVMAATTETLKLARVAGMGYAEAADAMTVAIRSFKMEMSDAAVVTDVYSKVAAVTASSQEELAIAMSKTASSAESVGSSFENTTAMLAVMIETTRESAQNLGSALKSIISRYGEMKIGATVDADGEALDYNKVDTALKSVGISIKDAQGQFRDFDDVIFELSEKWDSLDKNTQRYIATIMAGNRQQSRFIALVDNWERLDEVRNEAENSEDAGLLQYSKTLDSLETKINNIKTSFQQFYMSIINGPFVGKVLEGINKIIQKFNKLGAPQTLLNIAMWIRTIKQLGNLLITKFGSSFKNITDKMKPVQVQVIESWAKTGAKSGQEFSKNLNNNIKINTNGNNTPQGGNSEQKQPNSEKKVNGTGIAAMGLGIAGSIFSGISTATADSSEKAGVSTWSGVAGNTLSYASLGMSIGGPWGAAAGALLGAATSLHEVADIQTKRAKLEYEEAKEAAEKSNIERAEAKEHSSTLGSLIKQYERADENKYNSEEAYQEWLNINNQLAEKYPTLISYMDAEGNAIINATQATNLFTKSLEKTYKATKADYNNQKALIVSEHGLGEYDYGTSWEVMYDAKTKTNQEDWLVATTAMGNAGDSVEFLKGLVGAERNVTVAELYDAYGDLNQYLGYADGSKEMPKGTVGNTGLTYEQVTAGLQELKVIQKNNGVYYLDPQAANYDEKSYREELKNLDYEGATSLIDILSQLSDIDDEMATSVEGFQLFMHTYLNQLGKSDSEIIQLDEAAYNNLFIPFREFYEELSYKNQEIFNNLIENLGDYSYEELEILLKDMEKDTGNLITEDSALWGTVLQLWNQKNNNSLYRTLYFLNKRTGQNNNYLSYSEFSNQKRFEYLPEDEIQEYYSQYLQIKKSDYNFAEYGRILDASPEDQTLWLNFMKREESKAESSNYLVAEYAKRRQDTMTKDINTLLSGKGKVFDGAIDVSLISELDQRQELYNLMTSTDIGTDEWLQSVKSYAISIGQEIDDTEEQWLQQLILENFITKSQKIVDQLDDTLSDLKSYMNKQKSGFSVEDSQKILEYVKKSDPNASINSLFEINEQGLLVLSDFDKTMITVTQNRINEAEQMKERAKNSLKKAYFIDKETFEDQITSYNFDYTDAEQVKKLITPLTETLELDDSQISALIGSIQSGAINNYDTLIEWLKQQVDTLELSTLYIGQQSAQLLANSELDNFISKKNNETFKFASNIENLDLSSFTNLALKFTEEQIQQINEGIFNFEAYYEDYFNKLSLFGGVKIDPFGNITIVDPKRYAEFLIEKYNITNIEQITEIEKIVQEAYQESYANRKKEVNSWFEKTSFSEKEIYDLYLTSDAQQQGKTFQEWTNENGFKQGIDESWEVIEGSEDVAYSVIADYVKEHYRWTTEQLPKSRSEWAAILGVQKKVDFQGKIDFAKKITPDVSWDAIDEALEKGLITSKQLAAYSDALQNEQMTIYDFLVKNIDFSLPGMQEAFIEGMASYSEKVKGEIETLFQDGSFTTEEIIKIWQKSGEDVSFEEWILNSGFLYDEGIYKATEESFNTLRKYVVDAYGREYLEFIPKTEKEFESMLAFENINQEISPIEKIKSINRNLDLKGLQDISQVLEITFTEEELRNAAYGSITYYKLIYDKIVETGNAFLIQKASEMMVQVERDLIKVLPLGEIITTYEDLSSVVSVLDEIGFEESEIKTLLDDSILDISDVQAIISKITNQTELIGEDFLNILEAYAISLDAFFKNSVETPSKILSKASVKLSDLNAQQYEAYLNAYQEQSSSIFKLFEGTGSVIEANRLQALLNSNLSEGAESFNLRLIQTSEGLKIDRDKFGEVLLQLRNTDDYLYGMVRSQLISSPEVINEEFTNVFDVLTSIQQIHEEIGQLTEQENSQIEIQNDLLQEQLSLYTDIYRNMSMTKSEGWDFLSQDLEGNAENFITFSEAIRKSLDMINSEEGVEPKAFLNMLEAMKQNGIAVQTITENYENWGALIRQAQIVAGEAIASGTNISLEDMDISSDQMTAGITEFYQNTARNQIKLLDAQIAMVEGLIALEGIGEEGSEGAFKNVADTIGGAINSFNDAMGAQVLDIDTIKIRVGGNEYPLSEEGMQKAFDENQNLFRKTEEDTIEVLKANFVDELINTFGKGNILELLTNYGIIDIGPSASGVDYEDTVVTILEETNNILTQILQELNVTNALNQAQLQGLDLETQDDAKKFIENNIPLFFGEKGFTGTLTEDSLNKEELSPVLQAIWDAAFYDEKKEEPKEPHNYDEDFKNSFETEIELITETNQLLEKVAENTALMARINRAEQSGINLATQKGAQEYLNLHFGNGENNDTALGKYLNFINTVPKLENAPFDWQIAPKSKEAPFDWQATHDQLWNDIPELEKIIYTRSQDSNASDEAYYEYAIQMTNTWNDLIADLESANAELEVLSQELVKAKQKELAGIVETATENLGTLLKEPLTVEYNEGVNFNLTGDGIEYIDEVSELLALVSTSFENATPFDVKLNVGQMMNKSVDWIKTAITKIGSHNLTFNVETIGADWLEKALDDTSEDPSIALKLDTNSIEEWLNNNQSFADLLGLSDRALNYHAGEAALEEGNIEGAIEYFRKSAEAGYKGAQEKLEDTIKNYAISLLETNEIEKMKSGIAQLEEIYGKDYDKYRDLLPKDLQNLLSRMEEGVYNFEDLELATDLFGFEDFQNKKENYDRLFKLVNSDQNIEIQEGAKTLLDENLWKDTGLSENIRKELLENLYEQINNLLSPDKIDLNNLDFLQRIFEQLNEYGLTENIKNYEIFENIIKYLNEPDEVQKMIYLKKIPEGYKDLFENDQDSQKKDSNREIKPVSEKDTKEQTVIASEEAALLPDFTETAINEIEKGKDSSEEIKPKEQIVITPEEATLLSDFTETVTSEIEEGKKAGKTIKESESVENLTREIAHETGRIEIAAEYNALAKEWIEYYYHPKVLYDSEEVDEHRNTVEITEAAQKDAKKRLETAQKELETLNEASETLRDASKTLYETDYENELALIIDKVIPIYEDQAIEDEEEDAQKFLGSLKEVLKDRTLKDLTTNVNGVEMPAELAITQAIAKGSFKDVISIVNDLYNQTKNSENEVLKTTLLNLSQQAMNAIGTIKSIDFSPVEVDIKVTVDNQSSFTEKKTVEASVSEASGNVSGLAFADGNTKLIAGANLAGKTLVGELGPELAVYDGMYHLLGENGAEFVNLPSDAIIFNHRQTAGIIKGQSGFRGTAMAEGNVSGPAYASGLSSTLEKLKGLRAMWQKIADMSVDELVGAGSGGGGGGGNSLKAVTAELQEWYNLTRQIENLEQEINNLIAERENIAKDNGEKYLKNLRETQKLLGQQKLTQQILLDYQEKQLERQRDHINNHSIWSKFITIDENGLLQYIKGNETNGGKGTLDVLKYLNSKSAEEQVKFVTDLGYSYTDVEGKKYKDSELVGKFFEELQDQIDSYHELYDTVNGTKETVEGLITSIEDINEEIVENQKELEKEIYDILVEAWEKEITALEEQTELIQEANSAYVEGIREALDAEKSLYEDNKSIEERESLQRQLSLLRRSGGSASEIADLEEQLNDTLKDEYFRNQERMIENIENANEEQIKKLEEQIALQKEALEYQKENGVLWTEVYNILAGTKEEILNFMQGKKTDGFLDQSALKQEEMLTDWAHKIGIYTEERQYENHTKAATSVWDSNNLWNGEILQGLEDRYKGLKDDQKESLKKLFTDTYANSMLEGKEESASYKLAEEEVKKYLNQAYDENGNLIEEEPVPEKTSGVSNGNRITVHYKIVPEQAVKAGCKVAGPSTLQVGQEGGLGFYSPEGWTLLFVQSSDTNIATVTPNLIKAKKAGTVTITVSFGLAGPNSYSQETQPKEKQVGIIQEEISELQQALTKALGTPAEKSIRQALDAALAKRKKIIGYSEGGLVDYTGIAMVHGSKSKPEAFLNATQTAQIKEALEATNGKENLLQGLHSTIDQLRSLIHNINTINNSNNYDVNIAPGAVVINVDQLADSYDVEALSADIMNRMVSIASKATNRGVNRR